MVILRPAFRKASSRRRPESVSKLNSVVSKMVASGLKEMLTPSEPRHEIYGSRVQLGRRLALNTGSSTDRM